MERPVEDGEEEEGSHLAEGEVVEGCAERLVVVGEAWDAEHQEEAEASEAAEAVSVEEEASVEVVVVAASAVHSLYHFLCVYLISLLPAMSGTCESRRLASGSLERHECLSYMSYNAFNGSRATKRVYIHSKRRQPLRVSGP